MAVKMLSLECPKCGANLSVANDRDFLFCEFCGQKIYMSDSNHSKYTYRKIDEARIREAEAKELVRLKEIKLEQEKLRAKKDENKRTVKTVLLFFGLSIGLLLLLPLFEALGII